jgi:hypothetical protein
MSITRAEAATALRDVEETTARTYEMRGYRYASPHLILWGSIWALGYTLMGVLPQAQWGWVWIPLDLAGFCGSLAIANRGKAGRLPGGEAHGAGRGPLVVTLLFGALFIGAVYAVFAPSTPEPYLVFPPLLLGLVYVAAGSWKMRRLAWIGGAVFLLTLAGYLLLKPWLAFWIAAVGGGGLLLGGLWLRKA